LKNNRHTEESHQQTPAENFLAGNSTQNAGLSLFVQEMGKGGRVAGIGFGVSGRFPIWLRTTPERNQQVQRNGAKECLSFHFLGAANSPFQADGLHGQYRNPGFADLPRNERMGE
jgi:hypothetical protein